MKTKTILAFVALNAAIFTANATQATGNLLCLAGGDTFISASINDQTGGVLTIESATSVYNTSCLNVYTLGDNNPTTAKKDFVKNGMAAAGIPWDGEHMFATYAKSDSTPGKLNFAFVGDIEIQHSSSTYICRNVYIGQGSSGFANNWWIFNNTLNKQSLECEDKNTLETKFLFPETVDSKLYDTHDTFTFYANPAK